MAHFMHVHMLVFLQLIWRDMLGQQDETMSVSMGVERLGVQGGGSAGVHGCSGSRH